MHFITHPLHTRSLGAPLDWDHSKVHCGSLSIFDTQISGLPVMESRWQLDGFETVEMMIGGSISLDIYGRGHPPVSLSIAPDVKANLRLRLQEAMDQIRAYAVRACVEVK